METSAFLSARIRKDPDALLRSLVITAIISLLVVLSLTGYGIFRIYRYHIISDAESDAINISESLYEAERDMLLATGPDGRVRLAVPNQQMALLDAHLKRFLHPFGIVKIKIYNPDCKIIYSTDPNIIGKVDSENRRLKRALSGVNDSKFEKKEEVQDLADERRFDVDVVETYVPVFDKDKNIIGSFEVYVDVTRYRKEIINVVTWSVMITASVLLFVFGCAFVLVRKGTNQLKETQVALEKLSITDSLTGVFNQRHILARARTEFSKLLRSCGSDCALGIIMLDVDYFKNVNDSYGHMAGDCVLQGVAERIVGSVRDYDEVGRYGGEEFLILLPNSTMEQTRTIAERIRAAVKDTPFLVEDVSISITASLGITCGTTNDPDFTSGLKRADVALYQAKQSGRNRIGIRSA